MVEVRYLVKIVVGDVLLVFCRFLNLILSVRRGYGIVLYVRES